MGNKFKVGDEVEIVGDHNGKHNGGNGRFGGIFTIGQDANNSRYCSSGEYSAVHYKVYPDSSLRLTTPEKKQQYRIMTKVEFKKKYGSMGKVRSPGWASGGSMDYLLGASVEWDGHSDRFGSNDGQWGIHKDWLVPVNEDQSASGRIRSVFFEGLQIPAGSFEFEGEYLPIKKQENKMKIVKVATKVVDEDGNLVNVKDVKEYRGISETQAAVEYLSGKKGLKTIDLVCEKTSEDWGEFR